MNTALHFSGGKDSMACLYLMKDRLSEIHVIFVNTGKFYPELLETVERVKAMCPHFHEVKTDQQAQNEKHGIPSQIVPIDNTELGMRFTGEVFPKVQSYLQCCYENISGPLFAKTKELGCSVIIRGQREDESHKSTAKTGDSYDGVTFVHPLEHWTRDMVLSYLKEQMVELPSHYALDHSSMDCYDCTAFIDHSADRIAYTKKHHPEMYAGYMKRLIPLHAAVSGQKALLDRLKEIKHAAN